MDELYKGFWYYTKKRQASGVYAVAGREGNHDLSPVANKDYFVTQIEYGKGAKQRALKALFEMIDRAEAMQ
jgi:hypothetical protein